MHELISSIQILGNKSLCQYVPCHFIPSLILCSWSLIPSEIYSWLLELELSNIQSNTQGIKDEGRLGNDVDLELLSASSQHHYHSWGLLGNSSDELAG
jgi:hypothetical protein